VIGSDQIRSDQIRSDQIRSDVTCHVQCSAVQQRYYTMGMATRLPSAAAEAEPATLAAGRASAVVSAAGTGGAGEAAAPGLGGKLRALLCLPNTAPRSLALRASTPIAALLLVVVLAVAGAPLPVLAPSGLVAVIAAPVAAALVCSDDCER
jgi:hypothetical protein